MIEGVILNSIRVIEHPKGDILHALKKSDSSFSGFGEAYFSTIKYNEIKGWKKHSKMHLNLIVPVGEIKFVLYDSRVESLTYGTFFEVNISKSNYKRLYIPNGIWVAFKGVGPDLNLLLNVANIEHDPLESETKNLNEIDYGWTNK